MVEYKPVSSVLRFEDLRLMVLKLLAEAKEGLGKGREEAVLNIVKAHLNVFCSEEVINKIFEMALSGEEITEEIQHSLDELNRTYIETAEFPSANCPLR